MSISQPESIRVLIADDHPVFRQGLKEIVSSDPRLMVVGESGEGESLVEMVRRLRPDVLLLDLNMPGMNGLDVATALREQDSPVKIIVLTMHKEEGIFNKAMDLGVAGYVLKESAVRDILDSIQAAVRGDYYISPAISMYLINRRTKRASVLQGNPGLEALTPHERKILKLISENKTSKEIADLMFISVRTVENHRMNICNKLNMHGSSALLRFAIENKSSL
jgi:DNA-binding NarL/FixJ family response regulator